LQIVTQYAIDNTGGDVLAGLEEMQICYDDLDKPERVAYQMFMRAGREMFAPKESV